MNAKSAGIIVIVIMALLVGAGTGSVKARDAGARSGGFTFRITLDKGKCQMAVWLEDEQGRFVDTVMVTRKTAAKGLGNRGGGLDDRWGGSRLSVLPVWAYRRGKPDERGNPYPDKDHPLPDTVTAASPKAGEMVRHWAPLYPLAPGVYHFYIEVNASFDDNEYHDYSWYRGQPSVVWKGDIAVGGKQAAGAAKPLGHGDPAGADGRINPDLSTLSTALTLVKKATAVFNAD